MSPLYVHETGQGPTALFLHGFPLDHTMWSSQTAHLADVAHCLAPDLRGFGRSPAEAGAALTMERHADDLARLLDLRGQERADVIGLSMGGYVALAFCERHAERVRSLALVDTRAGADDATGKENRDLAAARVREHGRAAFAREMLPHLVAPDAREAVRAKIAAMIETTAEATIVAALAGMRDRPDRTALLETIVVPALVVCGDLDTLTPPSMSAEMARLLPHGELAMILAAGHMSPMEAPEAVNAALRAFLLGVPDRSVR